ncbi:hypothetical protein BJX76DRAFT_335217 [Aspergillus varians]
MRVVDVKGSILSAYCFRCDNYNFYSPRGEIILVGYSRGAFTVRCLAAFTSDVGLIRRKNLSFLQLIFKRRLVNQDKRDAVKEMVSRLNEEEQSFSHLAKIQVLAEWDTVSSIRIPIPHFPWKLALSIVQDTVPSAVRHAFLALSLDERRQFYAPMPWKSRSNPSTLVRQCAFKIAQIQPVTSTKFDLGALFRLNTVSRSMRWKKFWRGPSYGAKRNLHPSFLRIGGHRNNEEREECEPRRYAWKFKRNGCLRQISYAHGRMKQTELLANI